MNDSTHRFFTRILYIALAAGAMLLLFNDRQLVPALVLYIVYTAVVLWSHQKFYRPEHTHPGGKLLLIAELLLALAIQYFDHTGFVELYLFIVIGDAVMAYGMRFSVPFTVFALASYTVMLYFKSAPVGVSVFWREIDASLLASMIYVAVLINARYNIAIGRKNQLLAEELQRKTAELERANDELKTYARELEQTADLRVRERLMQELHNKLGHLLTTAAVGVQAAQVLSGPDADELKKRLDTVAFQLQTAMRELRDVVRGRETQTEQTIAFSDSITRLIEETEKHADIRIRHSITAPISRVLDGLEAAERSFLYNALMEGLTNGIRHGEATEFLFLLNLEGGYLRFLLRDNGKGFEKLVPGFGLQKIQKNAERLGAAVNLRASGGGELEILLPIDCGTEF